jgi:carboxypeptidase PM20D1
MKKVILSLLTGAAVLVSVLLVRTALHQPEALPPVTRVDIPLDGERIANRLSEAIGFRTISHQRPEAFQAEEFEDFIAWVAANYPEVHAAMELQRVADYTLLYRWPGSNSSLQPVLLTGHYDVVPVIPGSEGLWSEPPFDGNVVDGIIWGRGALDDKSAVIAQLEAATHLINQGFQPQRTLYFSFGHDEEIGGRGAAAVTQLLSDQGVQLEWSLDEGSFLFDGMLPGVEPLTATINVAEKGSITLEIVAKAAGGHSSMPPQQTAVGILAEAISALDANPVPGGLSGLSLQLFDAASREMSFPMRIPFANRWLFESMIDDQLSAVGFGNAMLRTTTAPTMLRASVKSNVLPIEAVATVNFRIHPRDSVEDVIDHVRSVVASDVVEVRVREGAGRSASPVSDWNSPGFEVIRTAIREVYGDVIIAPGLMIAASDTRHYGKIADNAFRFNPMIVTPEDLTGFHGTNEKISVDNLLQGVRTYIRIIRAGAGSDTT